MAYDPIVEITSENVVNLRELKNRIYINRMPRAPKNATQDTWTS